MGTNFYLHASACSECGRADPPRHIGKRSAGWVFLLHVERGDADRRIPENLAGWEALFNTDGLVILDGYGCAYTTAAMLLVIREGRGKRHPAEGTMHEFAHDGLPYDRATGEFS